MQEDFTVFAQTIAFEFVKKYFKGFKRQKELYKGSLFKTFPRKVIQDPFGF